MHNLDKIRADIAATKDALARLADGHLSRDDAKQRAADWVDSKTESFDTDTIAWSLLYEAQPVDERGTQGGMSQRLDMGAFVAWLAAPMLKQRLTDVLDGMPDDAFSDHDASGRAKQVSQLERKLQKLEVDEERTVCELERQGLPVRRRADCRPEIVLASPEEAA